MNLKKNQMKHIFTLLLLGVISLLFSGCLEAGLTPEEKASAKAVNVVWLESYKGYEFQIGEYVKAPCYVKKSGDFYRLYDGYVSVSAMSSWGLDSKLDDAASKKYPVVCYLRPNGVRIDYTIEDVEDYQE